MSSPKYGDEAVVSAAEQMGYFMHQSDVTVRNLLGLLSTLPDAEPPAELVNTTLDRLDEVHSPPTTAAEPS
jgi:hypothetical protein